MLTKSNNVFVLNKPQYVGSSEIIQMIKKTCQLKKIGHGGTLDPLATGVLVIGINNGTKLLTQQLDASKEYIVTMEFGYQTDTQDRLGKTIATSEIKALTQQSIIDVCSQYQLHYEQTVPQYSAVKFQGQELYKYARQGITIPDIKKTVQLLEFEIISMKLPVLIMRLVVSKGFYVRAFCNDLGLALHGYATMTELCRTRSDNYKLDQAMTPTEFISYYQKLKELRK